MVRKLAAALLGVGVFIPGLANALGLGEIKLNSALSEPLDAEIELVQVRELTATEILPSLASNEDFKAAGVERYQFLGDLKFEVVIGDNGRSYLKVRSRKPIKEPFLNFLVEVNWPAGRLLREYTMLLDPPIYSAQKAQPVKQAQAAPAVSKAATSSSTKTVSQPSYTSSEPTYTQASGTAGGSDTHTISSNDSLWSIAKNLKPSDSVSVQQTMIALQRYNPDAFIDGNINLLRRGQVLRAPTEAQAMEVSSREAIEMVAEQNRLWRDRIASRKSGGAPEAQQMDLSGRTADRPAPTGRVSDEGRLKLLSGTDSTGGSGQGGSDTGSGQLRSKLAQAEESVDKFKLENEDLKVKMNDLEDQIKTSEKVLSLKDQQIAALQAKLAELERQAKEAAAAPAAQPEAQEPVPVSADIEEPPVAETPVEEAPVEEVAPVAAEVEPVSPEVDFNYQEEAPAQEEAAAEPEMTETPVEESAPELVVEEQIEPVVQQPAVELQPEPVAAQPTAPAQEDLITQLTSNPAYLAIGGGAILLILAAALVLARRKKQEEEFDESIDDDFKLPDNENELQGDFDVDLEDSVEDVMDEVEEAPVEETVPQTADVLGEADIYIAYGRYPQALEMLQKAAEKEPNRADIRMKLCEVAADAKEPETFMTHYRALQGLGTAAMLAKADDLRARVAPDLGGDETVVDDFEQAFTEEAVSESVDDAESFDFDISDDADATVIASSELEQESDTGLDFDLGDLEDTGTSFASDDEPVAPAKDVASLDFDFEMDSEPAAPVADSNLDQEDGSLDFDLDLAGSDAFDAPAAKPVDDAGSSLDFDTEFSLDEIDSNASATSSPASNFDEELSLDFDQMETSSAEPASSDASGLDFDLDFDVESAPAEPEIPSLDSDQTIAFTPGTPVSTSDETELDSASAAQLADELDFDVGLEAPTSEDDATVIAPALDSGSFSTPSAPSAPMQPAANDFSGGSAEDELDFLSDADETSTKLDLARAYIDMGDRDGARDILDEVMIEGSDTQKQEAKDLLMRLEA